MMRALREGPTPVRVREIDSGSEEFLMDAVSAVLLTFGLAILLTSWVMLIITSFRDDFTWGLSSIFLPPLAYLYGCFKWSEARDAILFAVLGLILLFLA